VQPVSADSCANRFLCYTNWEEAKESSEAVVGHQPTVEHDLELRFVRDDGGHWFE
jgi:hypothetical protein